MQIFINNKPTDTTAETLQQLADQLALPTKGVAVAMENMMIPREQWSDTTLSADSHIVIIKAACGG